MKTFIFALLLLISTQTFAENQNWTTNDSYREAAFLTLLLVDYKQTIVIAENPRKYKESGISWAIGEHPTNTAVTNYFSLIAIAHPLITYYLPAEWRKGFQYLTIGEKIPAVVGNYNVGIRIAF